MNLSEHQNFIQISKDFGVFYVKNEQNLRLNPRLFPSVSFDKNNQIIRFFYPGPNGFGQQSFDIEYDYFVLAFYDKKFKHSTPKKDYLDLIDSIQFYTGHKLNDRLVFLFNFFTVTPTILKQAVHQNKKLKRKIKLMPKSLKLLKMWKNI